MREVEPGYYDALTASALCRGGSFKLCGRELKPFSFRHSLQLDAHGNALWTGDELPTMADFLHAAQVCSREEFLVQIEPPGKDDFALFDYTEALSVWTNYLRVCYQSRPTLWKSMGGGGSHCKAPMEEFVIAFILRNTNGYTREFLETAAVGLVLWIFEAIAEQIGTRSRILLAEDVAAMEQENTPAAEKARARREKTAGQIFKRFGNDPKTRMKLLDLLDKGKLPKDWRKGGKRG